MSNVLAGVVAVVVAIVSPPSHRRAQGQHLILKLGASFARQHVQAQRDVVGQAQGAVLAGNHQSRSLFAGASEQSKF